jgi:hypothetical protein
LIFLLLRVPLQLLCQIGRNMRDDRCVVAFVPQLKDMADAVDLGD